MRRLFLLGFALIALLASCASPPPPHGQDPFYLAPSADRTPTSSSGPEIGPHRGGGMTGPSDPRPNGAFPTGGSMSFGSGGGL